MSQAALADAAGLSERTVKRAEAGSTLSPETAQALSSVLGLPPGTLASGPSPASGPVVETTMPSDALALDPRRHTLDEILRSGIGTHVIVPNPSDLETLATWTDSHETLRNRIYKVCLCATLASIAIGCLLEFFGFSIKSDSNFYYYLFNLIAMTPGISFVTCISLSKFLTPEIIGVSEIITLARESIIIIDRTSLHVVRVNEFGISRVTYGTTGGVSLKRFTYEGIPFRRISCSGEHMDIGGIPVQSALDMFAGLPKACAQPHAAPAMA